MANGELAYMILRLQRDYNPRRNLKHKANQFNGERLEVENTGCFLLLCNYLTLYHIFKSLYYSFWKKIYFTKI